MRKLTRTFDLTKEAAKSLLELPAKQCRQVFKAVLGLSENPEPHDSQALKGDQYKAWGLRRVDVGEYRVIYRYTDSTVEILLIGKRNDGEVYKTLGNKNI